LETGLSDLGGAAIVGAFGLRRKPPAAEII